MLTALSCIVTVWAQGESVVSVERLQFSHRISNALVSYASYLGQLFCPRGLAVFYPHPGADLPMWKVVAAAAVLAGITAAALAGWRRRPYLVVGWLWYLGMLAPVIGLTQTGLQASADRFTYLPEIGLCLALIWAAGELCQGWSFRRWACGVASVSVLAVLMGCAWRQTCFWRNSETLWTHALACTSRNYLAHRLLGTVLVERREFDGAIAHQRAALEINPSSETAHFGLGNALAGRGKTDEAIAHYRKALALDPNFTDARYNLAVALASRGQFDEAIGHYQRVSEIQPDRADAHNSLGLALAAQGRFEEATAHYRKALEIQPDYADASYNLGIALAGCGQFDEALLHLQPVLELRRDDAELQSTLGDILAARGQFQEAVAHYRKALEIRPDDLAAERDLAWLRATCPVASQRNGEEALALAERANRRCAGKRPDVLDTLAAAYAEIGWFPEAVATEGKALELATQQHAQSLTPALRARMAGYQAGRPFRQAPWASTPRRPKP